MLLCVIGSDRQLRQKRINELFMLHGPVAQVFSFDANSNIEEAAHTIKSTPLFGGVYGIRFDDVLEDKAIEKYIKEQLDICHESKNIIVFSLETGDSDFEDHVKKLGGKVEHLKSVSATKVFGYQPFTFSDSFVTQQKKNVWIEYLRARSASLATRELIQVSYWAMKTIALMQHAGTKEAALALGIKPFVYGKFSSYAKQFSQEQVTIWLVHLMDLLHAHPYDDEALGLAFEQSILTRM